MLGPRVKARRPFREVIAKVPVELMVARTRVVAMEELEVIGLG